MAKAGLYACQDFKFMAKVSLGKNARPRFLMIGQHALEVFSVGTQPFVVGLHLLLHISSDLERSSLHSIMCSRVS